jgi:hypothetical protein
MQVETFVGWVTEGVFYLLKGVLLLDNVPTKQLMPPADWTSNFFRNKSTCLQELSNKISGWIY